MAHYIRCPECSFTIGTYAEFVDNARQAIHLNGVNAKDSEFAQFDPEKMVLNPNAVQSLEHLFEAIGVKNRCCRMHLVAKTEFDKAYK